MSLTAFQRYRRMKQVEEMKPENIEKKYEEPVRNIPSEEVKEEPVAEVVEEAKEEAPVEEVKEEAAEPTPRRRTSTRRK